MVNSDKQSSNNTDREIDDVDSVDDLMAVDSSPAAESLSEVLEGIFVEDGDGDLVVQRNREDIVLRFLQALDMQVILKK
ncbi:hypothetical protein Leryth_008605 [Lithospermum erythrorhizon]|nr:hypothetical protein Leryth_008605 [Lithospermum erythrorhizon]